MSQPGLLRPLKAAELSDGTLRYLLWIAALLSPRPPELLVLNEPETSLHPDLLPALARLIARRRTALAGSGSVACAPPDRGAGGAAGMPLADAGEGARRDQDRGRGAARAAALAVAGALTKETGMTKVYVSAVIDAPIEKVWAKVRDFNGLPTGIRASPAATSRKAFRATRSAACATSTSPGAAAPSASGCSPVRPGHFTYCILTSPLPVEGYVATLKLHPITVGTRRSACGPRSSGDRGTMPTSWRRGNGTSAGAGQPSPRRLMALVAGPAADPLTPLAVGGCTPPAARFRPAR